MPLPIVTEAPRYPREAALKNIHQGYVIIEFTVSKTGTVRDIVVIDSRPPGIFDKAAIKAATKFRYKPGIVNGEPVDVPNVRTKISFQLAK